MVKAIKTIRKFQESESSDSKADEAMGIVLGVMRGEIGGRYVGDRLRAAIYFREDRVGKPIQRHQVSATVTLSELVRAAHEGESGDQE